MSTLGVIFDMDGVLVDSYAPHLQSWRMLAKEIGSAITDQQFDATFGRTSREIIHILFGDVGSDAEIRQLDQRKEALYREIVRGRVPAMPGAVELVKMLHVQGIRLAIGSSGPPENVALIESEMKLTPYLLARVTGADVTRGKPDPQVFQIAAERLRLRPAACMVIEDAPVGIEAARLAGCGVIGLTSTHSRTALSAADHVVARLSEISVELVRQRLN